MPERRNKLSLKIPLLGEAVAEGTFAVAVLFGVVVLLAKAIGLF
jgi:hypothetical protein